MNKAHVLRERGDSSRQPFQHDGITTTLTLARQTRIRMPMLDEETTFTALFVLDNDVPTDVRLHLGAFTSGELTMLIRL